MISEAVMNFVGYFMDFHEATEPVANIVNTNEFDASYKKREKVEICQC